VNQEDHKSEGVRGPFFIFKPHQKTSTMPTKKTSAQKPVANAKLWGGRFKEELNELAFDFSKSIETDRRFYREDIAGSLAHVEMLAAERIISKSDATKIAKALKEIQGEIERGTFPFQSGQEDIHMAIEQRLREKVGAIGGKLHTARSRNDQVALDERLYLRRAINDIIGEIKGVQTALLQKAKQHADTVMPGYTHLQRAQPVLLSHHLLAYISMFQRDVERFQDGFRRLNLSPLGAAALGGTSFPIDRERVATSLAFDGVVANSIDAVSDRDYLIEFASTCAITMMHLSRLAEEMVLWSSTEFRFITIGDAFTTGSSIMPQKKNPDMAELARGKTGKVYGALMNLLTLMKGLPLAYNRDMQEDKSPMFDAADTTKACLKIFAAMLSTTEFHRDRLRETLNNDFSCATEIADYLVRKNIPFRDAHEITGKIVAFCIEKKRSLASLAMDDLQLFSSVFRSDVFECLVPEKSVALKQSKGSTSPKEVKSQIAFWEKVLRSSAQDKSMA
jgi:argininosuccinate lyase